MAFETATNVKVHFLQCLINNKNYYTRGGWKVALETATNEKGPFLHC